MDKIINPEMIHLAREARGLTQAQLAEKLAITQAAVSKAEKIHGKVSDSLLEQIASILDFPISFFLQQEYRYPPAYPLHRKKQSLSKKLLGRIEAEANIRRLHVQNLLDSLDIPDNKIPSFEIDEYGTADAIATATRRFLRLPSGPIVNLTKVIESLGIIIIQCDFYTDQIDGFTLISGANKPIIFINYTIPWCRARFTLSHELGHIIMNHIQGPNIEKEANDFASSFLMPKEDIVKDFMLKKLSIYELSILKPYWKVSMQALLVRAKSLNYIDENQARYLWMNMSQSGYRKREPPHLDVAAECPSLFNTMIKLHKTDLEYTDVELLDILAVSEDFYSHLYPLLRENKKIKLKLLKNV